MHCKWAHCDEVLLYFHKCFYKAYDAKKYYSHLVCSINYFILIYKFLHQPKTNAGFFSSYKITCYELLILNSVRYEDGLSRGRLTFKDLKNNFASFSLIFPARFSPFTRINYSTRRRLNAYPLLSVTLACLFLRRFAHLSSFPLETFFSTDSRSGKLEGTAWLSPSQVDRTKRRYEAAPRELRKLVYSQDAPSFRENGDVSNRVSRLHDGRGGGNGPRAEGRCGAV